MSKVEQLRAMGFDNAEHVPFTKRWRVRCSQCQAMTINGYPTHEQRCPNTPREDFDQEDN